MDPSNDEEGGRGGTFTRLFTTQVGTFGGERRTVAVNACPDGKGGGRAA